MMMSKRTVIGLLTAAMLSVPATVYGAATVRIGYSMARTGLFAVATPVQQQAYDLWRDQLNAEGGLNIGGTGKRKIEFVSYDDQSEPAKAAQIYEKLISNDKVDLLLAPWGTATHIAVAPVVERHKFPVIGNTASSTLIRDLGAKYMWFLESLPDDYGNDLTKLLGSVGIKRVAIITMQLPLALETKKFLVPALHKAGIEIVFDQEYPPDIKDMTGLLTSLKATTPDAVMGLSYPSDSIIYLNTARELGLSAKFQFLEIGPTEPFLIQKFGENLDGIVTLGHWSPDQKAWPKARPFFDAYKAKFNEAPDYLDTISSYMSAEILQQAVGKAGLDREKIRDAIATGTFDTINGPVRFNGPTNVGTPDAFLQIQKGIAQIIWPDQVKTADFQPKGPWK
jgi:branched-chain amino acid transport system substrate-binding protein